MIFSWWHKWRPVAVCRPPGATVVLFRCSCGALKTKRFDGDWPWSVMFPKERQP